MMKISKLNKKPERTWPVDTNKNKHLRVLLAVLMLILGLGINGVNSSVSTRRQNTTLAGVPGRSNALKSYAPGGVASRAPSASSALPQGVSNSSNSDASVRIVGGRSLKNDTSPPLRDIPRAP